MSGHGDRSTRSGSIAVLWLARWGAGLLTVLLWCCPVRAQIPALDDVRVLAPRSGLERVVGYWLAIDLEGERPNRSVIHVYHREGRLYGRIVRTLDARGHEIHPVCDRCAGDLKGLPYSQIEFIRDLRPTADGWTGGTVIDLRPGPLQGTVASCDLILLDGDRAELRGYLGPRWLGRSSVWIRQAGP